MAGEPQNGHDPTRLDRIERMIEVLTNAHIDFEQEHRQLLTAQVVLTDRVDRLTERVDRLTERVDRLAEKVDRLAEKVDRLASQVSELVAAQKHTDERLNALITIVDNLIRNPPSHNPPAL
ncbi:MAG TPA: cell division protein ZapB [Bryobacteraceae bacterium]|nr:cell division protein ZapB [Bryobacteraceae bacterium]